MAENETYQRLLDASGQLFAVHGFEATTVRDICKQASANVAAVNYHFRDKNNLYLTVLRCAFERARQQFPYEDSLRLPSAEERLHEFVRLFLLRSLGVNRPDWQSRLILREIVTPTPAFDPVVREFIAPMIDLLHNICKELLGPNFSEIEVTYVRSSVLGQCMIYAQSREITKRLSPGFEFTEQRIEEIAAHISRFSVAAIRNLQPAEVSAVAAN